MELVYPSPSRCVLCRREGAKTAQEAGSRFYRGGGGRGEPAAGGVIEARGGSGDLELATGTSVEAVGGGLLLAREIAGESAPAGSTVLGARGGLAAVAMGAVWESWRRAGATPGAGGLAFCASCWDELVEAAGRAWMEPFCVECGRFTGGQSADAGFIEERREEGAGGKMLICFNCAGGDRSSFPFVGAVAAAPFEGVWREAVHALKYHGRQELAAFLGQFLVQRMLREEGLKRWLASQPVVVIPVPLHPARQEERGFNQAELIARVVARELGLDFWPQGLERLRDTPSQTGLAVEERRSNLQGAFGVAASRRRLLRGRGVLLVDDVLTTGSTCSECVRVLQEAGSGPVWVATVAAGRRR